MTIRELTYVYPFINTISRHKDLSPARRVFIDGLLTKLTTVLRANKDKEFELITTYGTRDPDDNERFRLKTKEQNDNVKRDMKIYRDGESDVKLTKEEEALCERFYLDAIIAGEEDYKEI